MAHQLDSAQLAALLQHCENLVVRGLLGLTVASGAALIWRHKHAKAANAELIAWLKSELHDVTEEKRRVTAEKSRIQFLLDSTKRDILNTDCDLAESADREEELAKEVRSIHSAKMDLERQVEKLKSDILWLQSQITQLNESQAGQARRHQYELEEKDEQIRELSQVQTEQALHNNCEIAEINKQVRELENINAGLEESLRRSDVQKDELQRQLHALTMTKTELEAELSHVSTLRDSFAHRLLEKEKEKSLAMTQRDEFATKNSSLQQQVDDLTERNAKISAEYDQICFTAETRFQVAKDLMRKHAEAEKQVYGTTRLVEIAEKRNDDLEEVNTEINKQLQDIKDTIAHLTEEKEIMATNNDVLEATAAERLSKLREETKREFAMWREEKEDLQSRLDEACEVHEMEKKKFTAELEDREQKNRQYNLQNQSVLGHARYWIARKEALKERQRLVRLNTAALTAAKNLAKVKIHAIIREKNTEMNEALTAADERHKEELSQMSLELADAKKKLKDISDGVKSSEVSPPDSSSTETTVPSKVVQHTDAASEKTHNWSRRKIRGHLVELFQARNEKRMPLYNDDKVTELQLPCFDPYYQDLPIPQPVKKEQLSMHTSSDIYRECVACHESYTKSDLCDHLPLCIAFRDYATYCKHLHNKFYVKNNTAFKTMHVQHCAEKDCQAPIQWPGKKTPQSPAQNDKTSHSTSEQLLQSQKCVHCAVVVPNLKEHLVACPFRLLKQAKKAEYMLTTGRPGNPEAAEFSPRGRLYS
ncbi:Nn.00g032350.m01.CDS01 [Neocucurbitaria sp. VM-36]